MNAMMDMVDEELSSAAIKSLRGKLSSVIKSKEKAEEQLSSMHTILVQQELDAAIESAHQDDLLRIEREARAEAEKRYDAERSERMVVDKRFADMANKPEIKFPEQKEVDLLPVSKSIEGLESEIKTLKLEIQTLKTALAQPAPAEWDFQILRDGANNMVKVVAKQKV